MIHFHWWYIPLGIWLYLFIGARLFRDELGEWAGFHARDRAIFNMFFWPIVNIIRVFVED